MSQSINLLLSLPTDIQREIYQYDNTYRIFGNDEARKISSDDKERSAKSNDKSD